MKKQKLQSFLLITFFVISSFSIFENVNAKFIDTENHDGVIVDTLEYISGIKDIDVYSNVTLSEYHLYLNGTEINNSTNATQYDHGILYPEYYIISEGTYVSGNISDMWYNDSSSFNIESDQISATNTEEARLDIFYSIFDFCFDYNHVNKSCFVVNITLAGIVGAVFETKSLSIYNYSTATFDHLNDFTNTGGFLNETFSLIDYVNPRNLNIGFRINIIESGVSNDFNFNTNFVWLCYESNKTINNATDYELIDSYNFNSTKYSDGIYNLTAKVIDVNNNTYQDLKWITIDNTPPDIDNLTILPSLQTINDPISISTNINDTNLNNSYGIFTNLFGETIELPNGNNQLFNYTSYFSNGSYNFYVYAEDNAGNVAYKNKTFYVDYVVNNVYYPNVLVSYPSYVFYNETKNILITTNNSAGFQLDVYLDGIFDSSTFYVGNITHNLIIPTNTLENITYYLEIFDDTNISYYNLIFIIQMVNFTEAIEVIVINYPLKVFIDDKFEIKGTFEEIANISIKVIDFSETTLYINVKSFKYRYFLDEDPDEYPSYLSVRIKIARNYSIIYFRNISIRVLTPEGGGLIEEGEEEPEPSPFMPFTGTDFDIFIWIMIFFTIIVIIGMLYNRYRGKQEKTISPLKRKPSKSFASKAYVKKRKKKIKNNRKI